MSLLKKMGIMKTGNICMSCYLCVKYQYHFYPETFWKTLIWVMMSEIQAATIRN